MEVRAPGTPLTALNVQPRAHVGISGVTAPKLNVQDDLLGSNTWMCAAIILGAAVAIRTLGRGALVKGLKRNQRSSKRIYMGVKGGMRNPYWYGGEESPRAPSWLPGYVPEEKDGETLPKPDEGSEPPASLPKFVNLEWWQSQPAAIKTRSPSYWRRLFNDAGERRFERFKPYSLPEAIDIIFAGYEGDWHDKDDTFELKLKMALDSKYPDQQIRTKVQLPNGLGKEQRVAVFCAPEQEKEMLDMGASIAGKTLQDQIQAEEFEFDVLITKPASMPALAKPGRGGEGESAAETEEKGEDEEADEDDGSGEEGDAPDATRKAVKDFEYLVGMPISTLTAEKVAKLMQEQEKKAQELQTLKRKKPSELWLEDLEVLETALNERDAAALQEEEKEQAKIQKAKSKATAGRRSVKRSASGPPAPKSEVKPKAAKESRSQSVGRRGMKRNASGPLEAA